MRGFGFSLALLLLSASPQLLAAPVAGTYVRTSLDDDRPAPLAGREPRRIRKTLDDRPSASHVAFPLERDGRLIRLSLEEGSATYGRLSPARGKLRRVRTTLD